MGSVTRSSSGRIIRRERVVDAVRTFHPDGAPRPGAVAASRGADAQGVLSHRVPGSEAAPEEHPCAGGSSVTVFRTPEGAVAHLEVRCRCGETLTVYLDPEEGTP